jgi:hypothetical protein
MQVPTFSFLGVHSQFGCLPSGHQAAESAARSRVVAREAVRFRFCKGIVVFKTFEFVCFLIVVVMDLIYLFIFNRFYFLESRMCRTFVLATIVLQS